MTLTRRRQRALQAMAFNTAIAVGITAFEEHPFWVNLVFSQCIGLSIWALIETSVATLVKNFDIQAHRLFGLVPLCGVIGYLVGTTLGGWLLGGVGDAFGAELGSGVNWLVHQPRKALGFLLISLAAGGVITYFFLSREQLAVAREDKARTQAQFEAAQRQAAESQLKLLQSQLEPHMLFNTLANLRALITLEPTQAQRMLDHLVAYLRATLNASRTTSHPLQAEFDRLGDYLELMAVRMGPRLHVTLDLPAELANHPVPPLILQPLVENAIKHGLEPKLGGGAIHVQASQRNGALVLDVRDTGVGLASALLGPEMAATGFGLAQVRERLHTTYGTQATLELIANNPTGTWARVVFSL